MDLLEPNDVVMADKGFLIEEELDKNWLCKLKSPLFFKDKIQFYASETVSNCKLSDKRVTVERAVSRIKQYKYFEGALPYKSLHNVDSVFIITCLLCNFHDPLTNVT
ncbi:THAP-type domain-containing protein [Trichonephila inaurata madagascariensis]|uniref:THAP-type domain-containing protein n=1 Tax=Trichonephila inaurata madagascariensis TaxID=2747483 RepID=A0A8X7CL63_9ARAC|nr:THAP-type domain-containing protein [Trichonephila inaurata madagascariensis]